MAKLRRDAGRGLRAEQRLMSRTSSLTHRAYTRLREDLLACRLKPGSKLNIKELSEAMEVSLGAVREALARLTSEGLVSIDGRRGFQAAPISMEDLRDLTATRVEIEKMCLRRSIENGDIAWESALVGALHRLSRTEQHAPNDPSRLNDDYAAAHSVFHNALVGACDSQWLLRLRSLLYAQSERYRYLVTALAHHERDIVDEHKQLVSAALARDADAATELLATHLQRTASMLLDTQSELDPPAALAPPRSKQEAVPAPP
jgi:DNA-binding GntR family transcriptional regulator